jgi:hypothetical protein
VALQVLEKGTGALLATLGSPMDLRDPLSVAVSERYVAATDSQGHRVVLFDKATGQRARVIGPSLGGGRTATLMKCPCDVAFDGEGVLYITDRENSRILAVEPQSGDLLRQIGAHGAGPGQFNHVNRLVISGTRCFATDRFGASRLGPLEGWSGAGVTWLCVAGNRVVVFHKDTGAHIATLGCGFFDRPNGVTVWKGKVIVRCVRASSD